MEPESKALTRENGTREATGFADGRKIAKEHSPKGLRDFVRLHRDECIIGAGIGTGIGLGVIGEAASSRSCYYFPTIWIFSNGDYAWACPIPWALVIAVASTAAVVAATVVLHRSKREVEDVQVNDSLTSREKIKYGTLSLGSMAVLAFSLVSILGMSKNIEDNVSTYFGGLGIVNSWELVFVAIPLATLGMSYGLKKLNQTGERTTNEDATRSGFKITKDFTERHRDAALSVSSTGTGIAMMFADNTISNGLGQQTVPAEVLLIAASVFATACIFGRIRLQGRKIRILQ